MGTESPAPLLFAYPGRTPSPCRNQAEPASVLFFTPLRNIGTALGFVSNVDS